MRLLNNNINPKGINTENVNDNSKNNFKSKLSLENLHKFKYILGFLLLLTTSPSTINYFFTKSINKETKINIDMESEKELSKF
jgi:hypothetical protein